MVLHFEKHDFVGGAGIVYKDVSGTGGTVEDRVVLLVHPDEVVGTVVLPVSIEMMADVIGFAYAPESGTYEEVNGTTFTRDIYERIQFTAPQMVLGLGRAKTGFELFTLRIDDVSFFVCEVSFAGNDLRRYLFDFHNARLSRRDVISERRCKGISKKNHESRKFAAFN